MTSTTTPTTVVEFRLAASKKVSEERAGKINDHAAKIGEMISRQLDADSTLDATDASVRLDEALFAEFLPVGISAEQVKAVRDFDDDMSAAVALATSQVAVNRNGGPMGRLQITAPIAGARIEAAYAHTYRAPAGGAAGAGQRVDHFGQVRVSHTVDMGASSAACKAVHIAVSAAFKKSAEEATKDAAEALS